MITELVEIRQPPFASGDTFLLDGHSVFQPTLHLLHKGSPTILFDDGDEGCVIELSLGHP